MTTVQDLNEIIKLYVGYYNRAPDPAGLTFWVKAFDGGFSLDAMAVDFSTQAETLLNYPFFRNVDPGPADYGSFVDSVYQNLFNRPPDGPGKDFWVSKLDAGEFTVGQVISLIIAGATTSPDKDVVDNKVLVGLDFVTKADAQPEYVFDADDIRTATDIQASVTEDPQTVIAAVALTDSYISSLSVGGSVITLTTGTDRPGGGDGGTDTQGSNADDVYTALLQPEGESTLQDQDILAAGGGTDTLNIVLRSAPGEQFFPNVAFTASDLEIINMDYQGSESGGIFFDLLGVTGLKQLSLKGGAFVAETEDEEGGETQFLVDNTPEGAEIRLVDLVSGVNLGFQGDRSQTTDDALDLFVSSTGIHDGPVFFTIGGPGNVDTEFEIANIETGGTTDYFLELFGLELEQINVTGTQRLHLENTAEDLEDLEVVDASGMAGGGLVLDATGIGRFSDFSFTGSGFDDLLSLSDDLLGLAGSLSLDGGAGTDTLAVSNLNRETTIGINVARGFEALQTSAVRNTFDARDFADIDIFKFSNRPFEQQQHTISGITDDTSFVFLQSVFGTGNVISFEAASAGVSLTFELVASPIEFGDVALISQDNTSSTSAITLNGGVAFADVTIISNGESFNPNSITALGSEGIFAAIDNENGPTNFFVTGQKDLIIGATRSQSLTTEGNARGFTASVHLDGSAATGALTIAGSAFNDEIIGGRSFDILYGLGGNDILTGNDGDDQFRFTDWDGTALITDFVTGTDKIGLSRVDFENTPRTTDSFFFGEQLSLRDYFDNLNAVQQLNQSVSNAVVELQDPSNTSQITGATGNALNTYVLVFNAFTNRGELWFDDDWSNTGGRTQTASFENITDARSLVEFRAFDFVEFI